VSKVQHDHGAISHQHDRPSTYKNWIEENMEKAFRAVVTHNSSIRRAAFDYSVPKSTLGDRVHGRVQPGSSTATQ